MADRFVIGMAPVDYGPILLRKPFRLHLTVDALSSGCPAVSGTEHKLRYIPLAVSVVSDSVPV